PRPQALPYTTLFRSQEPSGPARGASVALDGYKAAAFIFVRKLTISGVPPWMGMLLAHPYTSGWKGGLAAVRASPWGVCGSRHSRSEEHTSELQSRED